MGINGKLVKVLDIETGISKSGKEWQKQSIVLDNGGEFNNLVCVSAFGDKNVRQINKLEIGMTVSVLCNIYSREYKGKWYNQIDGYHFSNQSNNPDFSETTRIEEGLDHKGGDDDLPF